MTVGYRSIERLVRAPLGERLTTRRALTFVLLTPVFAVGAVVASLGRYDRPASDDYRFAVLSRTGGPLGIMTEMWGRLTGRIGNGLLCWLVYVHPAVGVRLIASAVFVGAGTSIFLLLRAVLPECGYHAPGSALLLGGFGAGMIVLLGQPHPYHIIYWAAGAITHILPFIGLLLLVTLGVKGGRRPRLSLSVAFLGGLFLATVDEAITLAWFALAAVGIATHAVVRRAGFALVYTAVLTAGFGGGLAILWSAPGNAARRAGVPAASRNPLDPRVLGDAMDMTMNALRQLAGAPGPWAALALGCVLGLLAHRTPRSLPVLGRGARAWLLCCPTIAAVGTAFAVQLALRCGFGPTPWICYRAWPNFTFVLVLALFCYGFRTARAIRRLVAGHRTSQFVPGSLGLVACGVLLTTYACYITDLSDLGGRMAVRAAAWDAQSARIRKARAHGRTVVRFKPLPIEQLWEPFSVPPAQDWVAVSIARYFRVSAIVRHR